MKSKLYYFYNRYKNNFYIYYKLIYNRYIYEILFREVLKI